MSDRKHIDRLFQEKFKDFEAKPNDTVWNAIQDQLEQPTPKSKVMPLWLRLAGVAALALLLFTVGNTFFGNTTVEGSTKTIVDTDNNNDSKSINNVSNSSNPVSNKNETVSENDTIHNDTLNRNTTNTIANTEVLNSTVTTNETTSSNSNKNSKTLITTKKEINSSYLITAETLQKNKRTQSKSTTSESKYVSTSITNDVSKKATSQNTSDNITKVNTSSQYASTFGSDSVNVDDKVSQQNASEKNYKNKSNVPVYAQNTGADNTTKSEEKYADQKTLNNKLNATTLKEGLAQTKSEEEQTNMNPQEEDAQTPNPLEEASLASIEDSIEKEKEEKVMNRWTVNANVAPVYYNTLGKGSHIHDQFIDNPKNGEINTSYGINVGYALNDRLKVRSGISKLNLSYDTANVIIYENVSNTPSSAPLRNINFVPINQGQSIGVLSANNLSVQQINGVTNDALNAALSQRLSYVEVPVEVEYALINKRVGVNIIGGVSTLILNDNEVVTEVDNRKTKIGEANNINNVSFTTNFGLGLDYKFSDTFKFNLEPTFKYQVNAYNETSGNFKPYIIGVYTGFSYKF